MPYFTMQSCIDRERLVTMYTPTLHLTYTSINNKYEANDDLSITVNNIILQTQNKQIKAYVKK